MLLRIVTLLGFFLLASLAGLAAEPTALWQIGQRDTNTAEFALGPAGYRSFADDGFFIVGRSDARQDWPYVHPGPEDVWAGGRASSGLASETVTLFRASKLRRVGAGGGVAHEDITVHEVPLADVHAWLEAKAKSGVLVDSKVYAGLYFVGRCG